MRNTTGRNRSCIRASIDRYRTIVQTKEFFMIFLWPVCSWMTTSIYTFNLDIRFFITHQQPGSSLGYIDRIFSWEVGIILRFDVIQHKPSKSHSVDSRSSSSRLKKSFSPVIITCSKMCVCVCVSRVDFLCLWKYLFGVVGNRDEISNN